MKNNLLINLLFIGLMSGAIFNLTSCTDLTVDPTDSEFVEQTGTGQITTPAADLLTTNYNDLGAITDQANIYSLTTHSSDEMIPPTRGVDWGDNGVWRTLHAHTWDAAHSFVNNSWNQLNERVFRCNRTLAGQNLTPQIEAEAKFLRAFYMWHVLDLWGKVPFREVTEGADVDPRVLTSSEAYDAILKDIQDALPNLPSIGPSNNATLASKASANALLARLMLNKEVYTGSAADYNAIIAVCDAVAADGYDLEDNFFDNFNPNASKEIIFASPTGSPQNRIWMTLHYSQNPSGWNGFTTLADFYNMFDANDSRRGADSPRAVGEEFHGVTLGFLIDQQFNDDGTETIDSRTALPLKFTPDVPLAGATTDKGIRVMKYHPSTYADTKYILFRYADVLLMKAEAEMRGNTGDALGTVNTLRAKRGADPLGSIDDAGMLAERGRELYWEGTRRTDLIRFGKFNDAWSEKPASESFRTVYPIPALALASNPNLTQNDGY